MYHIVVFNTFFVKVFDPPRIFGIFIKTYLGYIINKSFQGDAIFR